MRSQVNGSLWLLTDMGHFYLFWIGFCFIYLILVKLPFDWNVPTLYDPSWSSCSTVLTCYLSWPLKVEFLQKRTRVTAVAVPFSPGWIGTKVYLSGATVHCTLQSIIRSSRGTIMELLWCHLGINVYSACSSVFECVSGVCHVCRSSSTSNCLTEQVTEKQR